MTNIKKFAFTTTSLLNVFISIVRIRRLWRSVKYEHVYLYVCEDGEQLWHGLKGYFRFYNHERLHQSLDYQTPKEKYAQPCAAA